MSNSWLLSFKNGGCKQDGPFEGSDRPVRTICRYRTEDSSAISRSTEVPDEVERISERQDGAQWNEREQTYDGSVDMISTENVMVAETVMVENGMYDTHVLSGFVQNGSVDAGSPSSEWVMSAGEFGQVLLEIPDNESSNLHAECVQLNANQVKVELGDVENSALSGNDLIDICNSPKPLKQSVMGVGPESLSNNDMTLFDCSSDKSITGNCDEPQFKLDEPNLFHIIEIVQQKHPLEIDISEKNILEQLSVSPISGLQAFPLTAVKTEIYDSSALNLQTVTFEKSLSVTSTSASIRCFPEECFSEANFENVMDANASSETNSHLCQNIDVPSVNYNDGVSTLSQTRSCKLNQEVMLSSSGHCGLRSDTGLSVMDLVLETSVFIKDGYESEIKKQLLTCGAEKALPSTFKDFSTDGVNIVTPSPAGFNDLDQSGIQMPLPVNVLSVVSVGNLSECTNVMVRTAANESEIVMTTSKQMNCDYKSQSSSSKSSVAALRQSAADFPARRKVLVLRDGGGGGGGGEGGGGASSSISRRQAASLLPEVDRRHEGEEVNCDQTDSKKFVCSQEDCDWSFPTAYKLRRHEETHEGRKDFVCYIEGCSKKFTTIYNLKTHLRLHKLPCTEVCPQPNCRQTFRNKRLLDKHIKLHCSSSSAEKSYKCPHPGCTKTFFSQVSIGSHARVHQNDSELICAFDGCGRRFDKLCRLKQHMRSHTGERPYRCTFEGCNWAFSTSSRLCRHLQMHNGQKKWTCPFDGCSKLFTRAEHVRGHLVTHSSVRPFLCTNKGCDARFKSKNSLDIHLKRHSQMDKKHSKGSSRILFYCPHEDCSQKFSTKAQLRAHIDSHERLSADPNIHQPPVVEHLPVMVSLELENLEGIALSRRSSSSSSSAAASKDLSFLTTAVSARSSNIVTSVDHSLFLGGAEQAADVGSLTSRVTTTTTLNLLTLPVLVASEPSPVNSSSSANFLSGSTRMDFTNYHLVNQRTMLKWQDQQQQQQQQQHCDNNSLDATALLNIGHLKDMASLSSEPLHCLPEQMTPGVMLNADEIMTSHAITFRDPETGTIYVQTQLMQDDPPSTNIFADDGSSGLHLASSSGSHSQPPLHLAAAAADHLTSMLSNDSDFNGQDSHDNDDDDDDNDDNDAFTGTTINLQDLE